MKIGIYGYGNLGRGIELAAKCNQDIEVTGIFTRRDPKVIKTVYGTPVFSASEIFDFKDKIDVLIICGGSATDLPIMTPMLAEHFNVVDSFDTHAHIPQHFEAVDKAAASSDHIALISVGWDPGLFSLSRLLALSFLPKGENYTFWGRGVSQGHSDVIRRIPGVKDARQYTVPVPESVERVHRGEMPVLTTREKHTRECFVVAEDGADKDEIKRQIVEMPNYFSDYDTTVTFISQEELIKKHSALPHGGHAIRCGQTGENAEHNQVMDLNVELESNPEFTSAILTACARAIFKMYVRGQRGCKTIFDITPADLSNLSPEELRRTLL